MKVPLFAHTLTSYSDALFARLGKGRQQAEAVYKKWLKEGKRVEKEGNAKNIFSQIYALTDFSTPRISHVEEQGSKKILLKTVDGLSFEMVLLPMQSGWTLCISSQIGCKIGCAFCETAKMGLKRSLSVEEIVSQLFIARHELKCPVRNIVFMGMGEPFDNYEAVMQACAVFSDMNGFALGPSHITVSTSGVVDKIYRFKDEAHPALNLAISINGSTPLQRERLMPITKQYSMELLRESMEAYLEHPRREIFIEYVLIEGRNDSLQDADALALYLKGLRVKINLIPYNPQRRGVFKTPSRVVIEEFANRLREKGFFVLIRQTKGERIMAACGQLRVVQSEEFKKTLVFSS